jgi:hypothetical protein
VNDMTDDLELKDLGQFYGTTQYHKGFLNVNYTDGVDYISQNGYSWLVTDAVAVIKTKLKNEKFLEVKLIVHDTNAVMIITDGNDKILYKQHHKFTDAKRNLTLFFADNVLMLSSEY